MGQELRQFEGWKDEQRSPVADCERLRQAAWTNVATCYGTFRLDGAQMPAERVEYVGDARLDATCLPETAPLDAWKNIMKQVMQAYEQVLEAGLVKRDGSPSAFALQAPTAEQRDVLGLKEAEVAVKVVDLSDAVAVEEASPAAAAAVALVTLLGLASSNFGFQGCIEEALQVKLRCSGYDTLLTLLREAMTSCDKQFPGLRFGADSGFAEVLAHLALHSDHSLGDAFHAPFFEEFVSSDPRSRRLSLARQWDFCKKTVKTEANVLCMSAVEEAARKTAEKYSCTKVDNEEREGYVLFAYSCALDGPWMID